MGNLECFISLHHVHKIYPNFKPKDIFEMLDDKGNPEKGKYVRCIEVQELGLDKWDKHFSKFKIYYNYDKIFDKKCYQKWKKLII